MSTDIKSPLKLLDDGTHPYPSLVVNRPAFLPFAYWFCKDLDNMYDSNWDICVDDGLIKFIFNKVRDANKFQTAVFNILGDPVYKERFEYWDNLLTTMVLPDGYGFGDIIVKNKRLSNHLSLYDINSIKPLLRYCNDNLDKWSWGVSLNQKLDYSKTNLVPLTFVFKDKVDSHLFLLSNS